MKIYGIVIPEGTNTPQNIADDFTPDEVKYIGLSDLPIMVDHTDTRNTGGVGQIYHDWVGGDGRKRIAATIRSNTKEEILTQSRILHGALKDFSLTHKFQVDEHIPTGQLFQTKHPIEVSVCRNGRRFGCNILSFALEPEDTLSKTTNRSNLYNKDESGSLSPTLSPLSSEIVMASNQSQTPANPMQTGAPAQGPSDLELLQELNRIKAEQLQWQNERASYQAEKENAAREAERLRQEQQVLLTKEIDSVLDAFCATNGTQKSEQMTKALEPIKGCKDLSVLSTFKNIMADFVSANSHWAGKAASLGQQVEDLKKSQLTQQYYNLTNQQQQAQNKFADPAARFTQPPVVNVPAPSTGIFFNPANGAVTTPIAQPQQQQPQPMQQQTPPQTTQTGAPVISNWSHSSYPGASYGYNGFATRGATEIKANTNFVPGAVSQFLPQQNTQQTFSLDRMNMFNHTLAQDSETRSNVFGAYDALGKGIHEGVKQHQQTNMNF